MLVDAFHPKTSITSQVKNLVSVMKILHACHERTRSRDQRVLMSLAMGCADWDLWCSKRAIA